MNKLMIKDLVELAIVAGYYTGKDTTENAQRFGVDLVDMIQKYSLKLGWNGELFVVRKFDEEPETARHAVRELVEEIFKNEKS